MVNGEVCYSSPFLFKILPVLPSLEIVEAVNIKLQLPLTDAIMQHAVKQAWSWFVIQRKSFPCPMQAMSFK